MDTIKAAETEQHWGNKDFHEGFDAAIDRTKKRLIAHGGDENGNISLQIVFDSLTD